MNTSVINKSGIAKDIAFNSHSMTVYLMDGRNISIPLEWFASLRDANSKERNSWRLIGGGESIHWDLLDEDILVENLL